MDLAPEEVVVTPCDEHRPLFLIHRQFKRTLEIVTSCEKCVVRTR